MRLAAMPLAAVLFAGGALLGGPGCQPTAVLDFEATAYPQIRTRQVFTAAFAVSDQNQAADALGSFANHDVVLFGTEEEADSEISHYVRLRTLWPYLAGLSHTTPSQINVAVEYVRGDRDSALLYEGAGLLHVVPVAGGTAFACWLKSAHLELARRFATDDDPLGRFEMTGRFGVANDPREHRYWVRRFERVLENLQRQPAVKPVPADAVGPAAGVP